ncbi:uncharacterized protein A4U43_C04F19250 [Asparagus officinalis]|uniref:Uncharacterized protein n=1 Tax=Asparagus officinalis TaxID=4686 RepID=A0A5P1F7E5_ASPOF|nr:uncharacterized protein A4U43_C04F19250 [Asparagus officinalis]
MLKEELVETKDQSLGLLSSYQPDLVSSPVSILIVVGSEHKEENREEEIELGNLFFGAMRSHWSPTGQDIPLSNVQVAADDYSGSTSDSSNFMGHHGYHPLEDLKGHERNMDMLLTDAEIARTTVEANSKALLVFPGSVHCEPHEHVSWAEYQYVIDDFGDVFFEIFDDENILQDRYASSPVAVLIGKDNSLGGENRMTRSNYSDNLSSDPSVDIWFENEYDEIVNTEVTDTLIKWGMPETMRYVHPMYFSKCLTKSVGTDYREKMEFPSNGISILGCLRPAFVDEESYLRRLFQHEDDDGYSSDWRDESEKEEEQVAGTFDLIDGKILRFGNRGYASSTLYKLEIMSVDLFSIYGVQSTISSQDFQDAEPDLLAQSASAIIKRFNEGMQCSTALKALCRRRKGLVIERANLIGVDSLGFDVRVSSGMEVQTLRFSFNARATSESAAEKKIKRMLFPRQQRKSLRTHTDGVKDLTSL